MYYHLIFREQLLLVFYSIKILYPVSLTFRIDNFNFFSFN